LQDFCYVEFIISSTKQMLISELFANPKYPDKFILEKFACYFLECSREQLWLHQEPLNPQILNQILTAYDKHVHKKQPLEYILGYVEFFKRKFFVDQNTLIPRPETEYMIQAVDERTSQQPQNANNLLLDIGTGCGVLWISCFLQHPDFFQQAILTDQYPETLQVAQTNHKNLIPTNQQQQFQFLSSNLLDFRSDFHNQYDQICLVANLPYIPEQDFEEGTADSVKNREPKKAFVGWDDWLDLYRIMLDQFIKIYNNSTKNQTTMFLEMMTRQIETLRKEYWEFFIFTPLKTFHFNIKILQAKLK